MKRNALQILMTAVLAFAFTGAFAQLDSTAAVGDFVSPTLEATDSVTIGQPIPYFVDPDPYFNPGFDDAVNAIGDPVVMRDYLRSDKSPAGTGEVTSSFVWSYTSTGTGTATAANQAQNYVEYTFDAVDEYQIQVQETSSFGTCPGGSRLINVEAIAAPEIAFTGTAVGIVGADITICDGADEQDDVVQVAFTTYVTDLYNFTLDYTYTVETRNDDDTWSNESTTDNTGAAAITGIDALTYDLNDHANNFAVVDNKSTRYTYTISGVTDRISRKSDYLANTTAAAGSWTPYDTTPETVVITVHPAPQTGPIYHISNTWAQ